MNSLIQFGHKHQKQLWVAAISTGLFHLLRKLRASNSSQFEDLQKELISVRTLKFIGEKKKYEQPIPEEILTSNNPLIDEVRYLFGKISNITLVPHLIDELNLKDIPSIYSPLLKRKDGKGILVSQAFIFKGSYVLSKNVYSSTSELCRPVEWLLAGPRKSLYFQPSKVKAAIVTCGGLCPGINVVIHQIYINLNLHYGCPEIWGIEFGYQGIYSSHPWKRLELSEIKNLQFEGGTTLGSSRGGFDLEKIIEALKKKRVNQLYVIGGDGSHRGIHVLHEEISRQKLEISVLGVPKTIDNDIPIIDQSFGFETSVSESIRAIRSARVESRGVPYGIGLVRLMGRNAGFIAMEASNSSRDVNLCLIPESKFRLYGENGVLEYIYKQLKIQEHLVIVVAEGAGDGVVDHVEELQGHCKEDESGNKKLSDIGKFLQAEIVTYCRKKGLQATLKYIDPTYMIRTVAAKPYDVRMCSELAAGAVHGAMAGFTGFTVGHVNTTPAMIPVSIIFGKQNRVSLDSRAWQRLLAGTGQPDFN